MCGGAIISDFVPTKPGRKSTASHDFWSDLDTFADLLGFDPSSLSASQHPKPPVSSDNHNNLPPIPPTTPGEFFFIYFLCQIIISLCVFEWCMYRVYVCGPPFWVLSVKFNLHM